MATDNPPLAAPEHYIVRVYRRALGDGARIAGTVEIVGVGTERSFRNLRELEQILCAPPAPAAPDEAQTRLRPSPRSP